jgi:hypothetical protein
VVGVDARVDQRHDPERTGDLLVLRCQRLDACQEAEREQGDEQLLGHRQHLMDGGFTMTLGQRLPDLLLRVGLGWAGRVRLSETLEKE